MPRVHPELAAQERDDAPKNYFEIPWQEIARVNDEMAKTPPMEVECITLRGIVCPVHGEERQ